MAGICWVDVEDSATGLKVGAGPLRQVIGYTCTTRLSKAGDFSLRVAAADPQIGLLLPKRTVHVWAILGGMPTEIGAGIIEKLRWNGELELEVSGPDLLGELRYRSVHNLQLVSENMHTPTKVFAHIGGVFHDLTQTYDGISAFFASNRNSFTLGGSNDFLYIGYSAPFNVLYTYQDAGGNNTTYNTVEAELNYGYSDGAGNWPGLEVVSDTQIVNGIPWPPSLVTVDPVATGDNVVLFQRNAYWQAGTVNGVSAYWIRIDPTIQLDAVSVVEFKVGVRSNRLDDVGAVMALAPIAWEGWDDDADGVTIFDRTTNGTYAAFAGELVLNALVKVAERAGESFRLGAGRTLHWLRAANPPSGVRALRNTAAGKAAQNPTACVIVRLEQVKDTSELITRIYPYGAGNGKARVTLRNATVSMPAGYVMDTAANYIKATAPETTYGRIERVLAFKDVRSTDDLTFDAAEVCNQLAGLALQHLQRHSTINYFYRLTVTGLKEILRVGETIRIVYREVQDGRVLYDINGDFIIISETHRVTPDEVYTSNLEVGTVNAWPATDEEILADMIEQGTVYESHPQPVDARMIKSALVG